MPADRDPSAPDPAPDIPANPRGAPLWDLPTRLVHAALIVLIPFSWWSATHDHLPWHRLSGYLILGLLLFRLVWGFAGPRSARFGAFLKGPGAVLAYVRGRAAPVMGHNPLGGWSVAAMFAALSLQVGLGLFAVDVDGFEAGPLSRFLSFDAGRAVARLHRLTFWVIVGLVALHLAAIAVYALRGRNLVGPMIGGRAPLVAGAEAPRPVPPWRALAVAAAAGALAWFVASGLRF